jgi:hypothetical protein
MSFFSKFKAKFDMLFPPKVSIKTTLNITVDFNIFRKYAKILNKMKH